MSEGIILPTLAQPTPSGPLHFLHSSLRRIAAYRVPPVRGVTHSSMVWTLALMLLGALSMVQWRSVPAAAPRSDAPPSVAAQSIGLLEAEQTALKQQIADLRARLAVYEQRAAQDRGSRGELARALEQQRLAAGVVALRGPGVRIVVDDSSLKALPPGEDPNRFIVHEYELRDIVNLLWLSGAEAMAVNGERLIATSSIYCVGTTILVNDTRLSPPFEIVALGDRAGLERAVNDPQALRPFKESVRRYSLVFAVSGEREVRVPAFNGGLPSKYAQPNSSG